MFGSDAASFGIIFLTYIHRFGTVLYYHVVPGHIIAAAQLRWTPLTIVSNPDPDYNGSAGIQAGQNCTSKKKFYI
jgi:hypothetical protein